MGSVLGCTTQDKERRRRYLRDSNKDRQTDRERERERERDET